MNVANLQIEGLLMAVAAVNHVLVKKGSVTQTEIDEALAKAQANMTSEERSQELSPAHQDAINFPIRVLQITNHCAPEADLPPFSDLARMVGEIKKPYNAQC